jgi:tetratricopeptide (TPR) repeat protein
MITHSDEEIKQGELEGLVLDKFLVDTFKPKICHERDIVVIAFLVKQKATAQFLSGYLAQGTFDIIDVDASSSPDEDGHYLVLVEMNRNHEMFGAMDNIIKHITDLVNIHEWRFKPYAYDEYIDWNKENFIKTVPQNPDAYFNKEADKTEAADFDSMSLTQGSSGFDFRFLGETIEKQIVKSTRTYIKALQKQFKSFVKSNKNMLQSIEDLRSDHQYMHQQLELYEKREKMALLREQQDYKHIRTLENKLSLLAPPDSEIPEMIITDSSGPIKMKHVKTSDTAAESKEDMDNVIDDQEQLRGIESESRDSKDHSPIKGTGEPTSGTGERAYPEAPSPVDQEKQDRDTEPHRSTSLSPASPVETSRSAGPQEKHDTETSYNSLLSQAISADTPPPKESQSTHVSDKIDTGYDTDTFIWGGGDSENEVTQLEASVAGEGDEGPVEQVDRKKDANERQASQGKLQETGKKASDPSTEMVSPELVTASATDDFRATVSAGEPRSQKDQVNEYIAQGLAAVDRKAYEKAIESFTKAFDLAPDLPRISLNLAILYYRLKDYEKARDYGQRALDLGAKLAKRILKKVEAKLSPRSDEILSTVATETLSQAILWGTDDLVGEELPQKTAVIKETDKVDPIHKVKITEPHSPGKKEADQETVTPVRQRDAKHQDAEASSQSIQPQDENADTPAISDPAAFNAKGSSKGEAAKKYFAYGLKAFEQRKYDKAIEYFRKVIRIFPKARRSFIRLAIVYYRLKDYQTARQHAQRAVDLGSKSAQRILEKVNAKIAATPEPSKADEFADTLPEFPTLDFEDIATSPDIGTHEPDEQAVEEKMRIVEPPVEIKEDEDQTPVSRAEPQHKIKPEPEAAPVTDSPEGEKVTVTAVPPPPKGDAAAGSSDSDNAEEYFNLGLAAAEQKDYHKAIEYFTKVTTLLPDAPPSFLNLANIQLELKNHDAAREHAQQALELGSEFAKRILEKIEADLWTTSVMSPKPNQTDLSETNPEPQIKQ